MVYYLIKLFSFFVNLFPYKARVFFFYLLVKLMVLLIPDLNRVARINLKLVFPKLDKKTRDSILKKNYSSLAVLIADLFRLPDLSDEWFKENVEFPDLEKYNELRKKYPDKAFLFLTGHLGSFELLAQAIAYYMEPINFVARNIKPEGLDNWWNERRRNRGNDLIKRKGAVRNILKSMNIGKSVGILFDQNITRKHAIFVDWFSKPAATTSTVAKTALHFKCPIIVISLETLPNGKYRINMIAREYIDIYNDSQLDKETKSFLITESAVKDMEKFILSAPAEWFWFHRRWKTNIISEEDKKLYEK